jgi:hypothetical protein
VDEMTAEAMREIQEIEELQQEPKVEGRPTRRVHTAGSRVLRFPVPEALLHPRAAEALVLAFRRFSRSR